MQVITKTNSKTAKKVILNRVSYIPGGVSIDTSNLVAGSIVHEGTPLTAPTTGKRLLCKQAIILATSTTTAIKVTNGEHHFKVGDFIGVKTAGKAYAITGITTSNGVDTLTVGMAIDTPTVGDFVYEMDAEAASNTSALKNVPDAILENSFIAPAANSEVIHTASALVRADVLNGNIGSKYLATLPGVINIKY